MIVINGKYARLIQPFVSKEPTRFYLNGFYVEPHKEGALIVATDGHKMGIFHDKDAICDEPGIVKLSPFMLSALRERGKGVVKGKRDLVVDGTVSNNLAYVVLADRERSVQHSVAAQGNVLIDGTFPDYRRVVPDPKGATCMPTFNPAHLSAFAFGHGRGEGGLTIKSDGPAEPALVRHFRYPEFIGVLMPMRADELPSPEWFFGKPKKKRATRRPAKQAAQ